MDQDQDRRTTAGILAGLLALALPRAASAQSPNIPTPSLPTPSPSPSMSPSRFPSSSPRDPASVPLDQGTGRQTGDRTIVKKSVGDLLGLSKTSGKPDAFELADGGIVLIENGQPFRLEMQNAANGRYELSLSGAINVQGGRAVGVTGQPGAVMAPVGTA